MKAGAELLLEDDDERTEAFRYDLSQMMEAAPDTERELAPIDDDDDGAMTMPFRRRTLPPLSFVKALPVIVIGPAVEQAPPAPAPRGPQTLRMNAVPARAPMHAPPTPMLAPVHAAPNVVVAAPMTKRSSRWPLVAIAMLTLGLAGGALFFVRNTRVLARARTASAPMPVAEPSAAPSLAAIDPPAMPAPSANAPVASAAPTASIARRPIALPPRAPAEPLDPARLPATGKLTVLCVPACDQVYDGGRPLGPSPVFKIVTSAGVHHLTLATTDPPMKKHVDVNVAEDDTTVVRQDMN
jgi:hypothetical protein